MAPSTSSTQARFVVFIKVHSVCVFGPFRSILSTLLSRTREHMVDGSGIQQRNNLACVNSGVCVCRFPNHRDPVLGNQKQYELKLILYIRITHERTNSLALDITTNKSIQMWTTPYIYVYNIRLCGAIASRCRDRV